jgi:hypothetical protein
LDDAVAAVVQTEDGFMKENLQALLASVGLGSPDRFAAFKAAATAEGHASLIDGIEGMLGH